MRQRPEPVGALAGRAIGDAGLAQMPVGGAEAALDLGGREGGKGVEEAGPDRPRAVLADIFVGNARQTGIVAHPLRHPAMRRAGLGRRTAVLTAWCPPSDSPPQKTIVQCGSGVLKSRVRGNSRLRSSRGGSILPGVWP